MIVEMQDVSWIRDGRKILKNVNWQVRPGEHWAVVGLNGSGKTSLLNIINGYIFPSQGTVSVLGHSFGSYDLRELRKSIGWVSSSLQEQLYVNETAEEIVLSGKYATIGLYDKPGEREWEQANDLLEELNCGHLAQKPYKTLSEGEKQKVVIARALISSPEILILDEPCSGLDIFAREQLLSTIGQISDRTGAPTLIYVTHHVEEILPLFSHILLLRRGEVHSAGETGHVLTAENLSRFFEHPVNVERLNGRMSLKLAGS